MARCATFDVTAECPLRCRHCYFFAESGKSRLLAEETWLARLAELVQTERLHTAFWVGGEPLLEPERLRRAMPLFTRNAVATSGVVPIPPDLDAGLVVSLEGLEGTHDALRGRGAFARALVNLARLPPGRFVANVTLTRLTMGAVEQLPALVEQTRAAGAVVGFFTGPQDSPLAVPRVLRDRVIDRLQSLAAAHPEVLLSPPAALELLRVGSALGPSCPYRTTDLAFDTLLRPRRPCTFGASADCASCGCPLLALRVAMEAGDASSRARLDAVFRPAARPRASESGTARA
jgi:Fe-coproporphyrin III synthase